MSKDLKLALHEFSLHLGQHQRTAGSELVNEARERIAELEEALQNLIDEAAPVAFVTGKGWPALRKAIELVPAEIVKMEPIVPPVIPPPGEIDAKQVESERSCRCSRLPYVHYRSTSSGCPRF